MQRYAVSPYLWKVRWQSGSNQDVTSLQRRICQSDNVLNDAIDIDGEIFGLVVPEERTDTIDHFARSIGRINDASYAFLGSHEIWDVSIEPASRGLRMGDDRGERLIELVRDGCSKLAHRRQSGYPREFRLSLLQCRLGALTIGHIHGDPDVLPHLAGFVKDGIADAVKMLDRPIVKNDTKRNIIGLS